MSAYSNNGCPICQEATDRFQHRHIEELSINTDQISDVIINTDSITIIPFHTTPQSREYGSAYLSIELKDSSFHICNTLYADPVDTGLLKYYVLCEDYISPCVNEYKNRITMETVMRGLAAASTGELQTSEYFERLSRINDRCGIVDTFSIEDIINNTHLTGLTHTKSLDPSLDPRVITACDSARLLDSTKNERIHYSLFYYSP